MTLDLNRRELLALALSVAGSALLFSSCTRPPPPIGVASRPTPPKLPEDSPDFDILNTLLQLEFYALALGESVVGDPRLDPEDSRVVRSVSSHHRNHISALEDLIRRSGGPVGEPRARYALPTPYTDRRGALESFHSASVELIAAYSKAFVDIAAAGLIPTPASIMFSEASGAAALRARLGDTIAVRAFA